MELPEFVLAMSAGRRYHARMIILMLVGTGVLVAVLLYVVMHKRPVNNNVGLADPSTWHVKPAQPTQPPASAMQPELMMPPPQASSERPAENSW